MAILQQNGFIDIRIQRQTRDTLGVNIPQEVSDFVAMLLQKNESLTGSECDISE